MIQRVIAGVQIRLSQAVQPVAQHPQFRGQQLSHHQVLAPIGQLGKIHALADEARVRLGQSRFAGGIHEQAVDEARELVARGAGDAPVLRQRLVHGEDLLHHQIGGGHPGGPDLGAAGRQAAEIAGGVVQAVRVIHPHAGDDAPPHQRQDAPMNRLEHLGILGTQPGQIVDVEEAPVVDLVAGRAPVGQPPCLALEQLVQPALRERRDVAVDAPRHGRVVPIQLPEPLTQQNAVTIALRHRLAAELRAAGQLGEGGAQAGELQSRCVRELGRDLGIQHQRVAARVHGKQVLVVAHCEAAAGSIEYQLELAAIQRIPVEISQHRQQNLAGEGALRGTPVDVEIAGVPRRLTVLQHVQPPGVVVAHHPHVVGNDVQDVAHALLRQGRGPIGEGPPGADLRIDGVVIDHVVAVDAAAAGLQVRRGVGVADAQGVQIVHQLPCVVEGETAMELQPVGGARRARHRRLGAGGALPFLGDGPQHLDEQRLGGQFVDVHRNPATPVRMLVHHRGQVRLLLQPQRVLELHELQHGGGPGEKAMHAHRELRFPRRLPDTQFRRLQGGQQPASILVALVPRRSLLLRPREQAEALTPLQIAAGPPPGQSGKVVGARCHQRLPRVRLRRQETPLLVLLEVEHPIGEDSQPMEDRGELLSHRAQVLPHDHAAVALAFQSDDAEEILHRVMHVSARFRLGAARYPEQPHQAHDVVEANGAGVAHVAPQGLDEQRVPRFVQGLGDHGRQAPVLAQGIVQVPGGAHGGVQRVQMLVRPGLRALEVDAHRHVQVEAHRQILGIRLVGRVGELLRRQPLQPAVEIHPVRVVCGEPDHGGGRRILVDSGPASPPPDSRILSAEMLLQRLEQSVAQQRIPLRLAEPPKGLRPRGAGTCPELGEGKLQDFPLELGDRRVVHQRPLLQGANPPAGVLVFETRPGRTAVRHLGDPLDIEKQRVQKQAAGRRVGAGVLRPIRKHGVQRTDTEQSPALPRAQAGQRRQCRVVTDAPVTGTSHPVELYPEPPPARPPGQRPGQITPLRHQNQRHHGTTFADAQLERVIAGWQLHIEP